MPPSARPRASGWRRQPAPAGRIRRGRRRRPGRGGGRFAAGRRRVREGSTPGLDVQAASPRERRMPLYDPATLRTIFLEFENADWEQELADFHNTDVDVPATLTVDGKTYQDVGVHFRGMSSFMMVPDRLEAVAEPRRSTSPTRSRRSAAIARSTCSTPTTTRRSCAPCSTRRSPGSYIPAPKANFVRVVINGESWGVYVNAQQFNKDFLREYFNSDEGRALEGAGQPGRPRRPGVPRRRRRASTSGPTRSRRKDDPKAWEALITHVQGAERDAARQARSRARRRCSTSTAR